MIAVGFRLNRLSTFSQNPQRNFSFFASGNSLTLAKYGNEKLASQTCKDQSMGSKQATPNSKNAFLLRKKLVQKP